MISLSGRPARPRVLSTDGMLWIEMSDPKMIQSSCVTTYHQSCRNEIIRTYRTCVVPQKLCQLNNFQAWLQQNRSLKPQLMRRSEDPKPPSNLANITNTIWISCDGPWDGERWAWKCWNPQKYLDVEHVAPMEKLRSRITMFWCFCKNGVSMNSQTHGIVWNSGESGWWKMECLFMG